MFGFGSCSGGGGALPLARAGGAWAEPEPQAPPTPLHLMMRGGRRSPRSQSQSNDEGAAEPFPPQALPLL
jgi:hypothetical protein